MVTAWPLPMTDAKERTRVDPLTTTGELMLTDDPATVTVNSVDAAVTAPSASLQVIVSWVPAAFTEAVVQVGGTPTGVTEEDATEALEEASPFLAVDVNVYAVPLVNPVTTHDVAGEVTVHVLEVSSTVVTTYDVGVTPVPAVTETVACPSPAAGVGAGGVPGVS